MILLRSLLFALLFNLLVVAYAIPMLLFGRWLGEVGLNRLACAWAKAELTALRMICRLDFHARGLERLPPGPAVVVSNHQSTWETIALRVLLPERQTWVLKQELLQIPFFGAALARFRPIALDRNALRASLRKLLQEGEAHLRQGRWVIVFPQGTRVAPGEWRGFHLGAAMLATKAGVPLVPIVHNAGVFWGRRQLRKRPGRIHLLVGSAIDPTGKDAATVNAAAEHWINRTLNTLPPAWEAARPSLVISPSPRNR
ncbi:MAG: 1-acyl-sn-glycerol-3-phosphate acyltransferase [Chromatiaceae bacterium]|nr:MAG: 1-acyl-sn-glycerol-3-phosphate acyltransferase [Chromatiaceae bacterium]